MDWFYSSAGERITLGVILPFVAIVVAGIVAALIARGGIKRLLRSRDRELKAAAVAGLVDAARQASNWNSLTPHEQALADRAASAADVQLRLLPVPGAPVAANWAGHEIRQFKRASATYSVQFDGPLAEFRDRLIDWQMHPRKSRRIFESDLDRWRTETSREERELQEQQDAWVAQQHAQKFSTGTEAVSTVSTQASSAPVAAPVAAPATPAPAPAAAQAAPPAPVTTPSPAAAPATPLARPSVPLTADSRADLDEPGSVEAPTDENYAPPVSATTVRQRTEAPVE
ncbi:hypothetical protein DDQ50_09395 [Amnibacterium flavum]|uniref:Uncharacterized protein n=1 Tax=Amnibacterium flavum TaxID=2173173 RepID=A0A2V1HUI9_9MICO|nr:hypothetical protein DDQ50_09395 [Amnibacterium flavum]